MIHTLAPKRRRRGFTLVELLMVSTISTLVMGGAAMLLVMLLRAESSQRGRLAEVSSLVRLQEQFRRDVAAADHAERIGPAAGSEEEGLRLTHGTEWTIEYHWSQRQQQQRIDRAMLANGVATARERYRLPANTQVATAIVEAAERTFVELRVVPLGIEGKPLENRAVRVSSLLGRDHAQTTNALQPQAEVMP